MNLSKAIKVTRVNAAAAAATSAVSSSIIDMSGFDGVIFIALTGALTINTVVTLTIQQSTANSAGAMAAITGAATAAYTGLGSETSNAFMVDVYRPQQQFLRAQLTRTAANAVVDGIIAIQYCADKRPTTQDVTTILAAAFAVPAA